MTDERIEREVRAWLAAEAAAPVPERLHARVAVLRPPATTGAFGLRRSWTLVIAASLLAILLVGAALFALGLLPPSPNACRDLTIDQVRAAVAGSAGYSYRVEGTTAANRFDPGAVGGSSPPFTQETRALVLDGAYQAPDRWRLDAVTGGQAFDEATTNVWLFDLGLPTVMGVGDEAWMRRWLEAAPYPATAPFQPVLAAVEPNALLALLSDEGPDPVLGTQLPGTGGISWDTATPDGDACVLHGATAGRTVDLTVDPASLRPLSVLTRLQAADAPDGPIDLHLRWSIDWKAPQLGPPEDPGPRPLTDAEALRAGVELGLVNPNIHVSARDGGAQVFVMSDLEQVVDLTYQDGDPISIGTADNDRTSTVPAAEVRVDGANTPSAVLTVLVSDPRVARIEVDLSSIDDQTVIVDHHPFAQVMELPNSGGGLLPTLNRWAAFDLNGNELVGLQIDR